MVGLPSAKVTHLPKEAPPTYQTKLNRDGSCGLRRRALHRWRPPTRRRYGPAASPWDTGGRRFTDAPLAEQLVIDCERKLGILRLGIRESIIE